jgi:predicted RNA binding protein YcfA (HicA-like mRNA interferase family)
LHPAQLQVPPEPIIGAASVHGILAGWRKTLQAGSHAALPEPDERLTVATRSHR